MARNTKPSGATDSSRDDASAATVAMVDFADPPVKSGELIVLTALFAAGADCIEKAVRIERLSALTGLPVLTIEHCAARAYCDAFAVLDREIIDDFGRRSRLLWIGKDAHDLEDQAGWHIERVDREKSLASECRKLAERMKKNARAYPFRARLNGSGRVGANVQGDAELLKFTDPAS